MGLPPLALALRLLRRSLEVSLEQLMEGLGDLSVTEGVVVVGIKSGVGWLRLFDGSGREPGGRRIHYQYQECI